MKALLLIFVCSWANYCDESDIDTDPWVSTCDTAKANLLHIRCEYLIDREFDWLEYCDEEDLDVYCLPDANDCEEAEGCYD